MEIAQSKSLEEPDEVRTFPNGEAALVTFGSTGIGLGRLHPGWSFEASMKALTGTDSCPFRHVGYAISGRLIVRMDDGTELRVQQGHGYVIPAGHQAAVEGDEDFVAVEFDSGALSGFGKEQAG